MVVGGFIKINYQFNLPMPIEQYYAGSIVFFSGTMIAEASSVALLSKLISPRLKNSYFNAGLLSGSADTIGRSIGNSLITIFAALSGLLSVPFYIYVIGTAIGALFLISNIAFYPQLEKHTTVSVQRRI